MLWSRTVRSSLFRSTSVVYPRCPQLVTEWAVVAHIDEIIRILELRYRK
jgi:hypothetical protein